MIRDLLPRRLAHPLEEREVVELVGAEDLQDLERLVVAQVLDEVAHVPGHDADVPGHVVERAGVAFRGEDGDAGATADEEGPLVRVGVPVHLAHGAGVDVEVGGCDGLGDGEVGGVGDADLAAGCVPGFLVEHLVGESLLGLLVARAVGGFLLDGAGHGALEDVLLGLWEVVEDFGC